MKIKTALLLAFILLINHQIIAQAPDWTRLLQVSTYPAQSVNVVTADAFDNYYFSAGISGPVRYNGVNYTSAGIRDLLISKVSKEGAIQWAMQFNAQANGSITANAMKTDGSGNIYISGFFSGTATFGITSLVSSESVNSFMLKCDPSGNPVWATSYLATGTGNSKIALDASDNIYLLSSSTKLIKFSSYGSLLWEQSYTDQTLQAIAVYGSNLYIGGALLPGTTYFGSIPLSSLGGYNTGFLVRADLDGNYNSSLVVNGSTSDWGSSVADIATDNSGNLIITGCYTSNLGLGLLSNSFPASGNYYTYAYLAKCNSDFVFEWMTSSSAFWNYPLNMYNYRLFIDMYNNIWNYGQIKTSFTWGELNISSSAGQYLIRFSQSGEALYFNNFAYSTVNTVYSDSSGEIAIGGSYNYENSPDYGNLYLAKYDAYMSEEWRYASSNSNSGTVRISYIKHDTRGDTYIQARVIGKCDYFGNSINTNESLTIISKHDIAENILWMRSIKDIEPDLFGCAFTLDKDNNVLTTGLFSNELQIETQTLATSYEQDGYVAKFSTDGAFLWASKVDIGTSVNVNIALASDKAGNVIVTGVRNPDNYLIKFSPAGDKIWTKILPMASEYFSIVSTDASNNIYLSSEIHLDYIPEMSSIVIDGVTLTQSDSDGATALFKFSPDGIAQWGKLYGGVEGASYPDGWSCDIDNDAAGNTYLWGWCRNNAIFGSTVLTNPFTPNQEYSYYLTKINSSGDVVWAKAVYEKKYAFNYGNMMDLDEKGNIYVGGHFNDAINIDGVEFTPSGTNDNFTAKFDNNGVFKWIKTIPANSIIINSLDVKEEDVLSLGGNAGTDAALGAYSYEKKGGSTGIVGTLGTLEFKLFEDIRAGLSDVNQSSVAWGDYDNDGDLDILLTGEFYNGSEWVFISRIYRNDAGIFKDIEASLPGVRAGSVAWGDYDNDGDLDILLTGEFNTGSEWVPICGIYMNDDGIFNKIEARLPGIRGSSVAWGDYDNDGDLDILLTGYNDSEGYISRIYMNDGGIFADIEAGLPWVAWSSVAWGDYDNDGDLDILITGSGISAVYRNDDGVFNDILANLPGTYDGSSVAWGDYDNDGDLDILLTGRITSAESISRIYRNDDGTFIEIASLTSVNFGSVSWGDYDNDGDLDILITGSTSTGVECISRIYRNDNGDFIDIEVDLPSVYASSVAWGDYDNDGDLDILLTGNGNAKIYRNNLNISNTAPQAPSNLQAGIGPGVVTLSWDKPEDTETPREGLSYNLYVGTSPGAMDILSPMAAIPEGERRIVQRGLVQGNSWQIKGLEIGTTYYWSVQAIDHVYAGGAWADENSFLMQIPPDAPAGLQASSCNDLVTLTWNAVANPDNNFHEYRIFGGTSPGSVTQMGSTPAGSVATTTCTIDYLTRGETYHFRIKAVATDGSESDFSQEVSVKVKRGVVPVIKAKWDKVLICYNIGDSIASFRWYNGEAPVSGATNQYYVSQNPGSYSVLTTDKDGCQNMSNSINVSSARSFTVYPNPAAGRFRMDLSSSTFGRTVITLYNSSGVKVLERFTDKSDNLLSDEIDTGNLRPGVYTLQVVVNEQEASYIQVVIIN